MLVRVVIERHDVVVISGCLIQQNAVKLALLACEISTFPGEGG